MAGTMPGHDENGPVSYSGAAAMEFIPAACTRTVA